MAKNKNYVPHNEFRHIETRRTDEDWENYLHKLSKTVGEACDRFFVSRGMPPGSVDVRTNTWKTGVFASRSKEDKSPIVTSQEQKADHVVIRDEKKPHEVSRS